MQAADLQKYLYKVLHNPSVDVTRYDLSQILEVKPHGVSKGHAASTILESLFRSEIATMPLQRALSLPTSLEREDPSGFASCKEPFLLAIGDDRSDESMFEALLNRNARPEARTIRSRTLSSYQGTFSHHTEKEVEPSNFKQNVSPHSWTVTVGCKPSHALHYLNDTREVVKLLDNCTKQVMNQISQNKSDVDNQDSAGIPPTNSVQQLTRRLLRKVTNV